MPRISLVAADCRLPDASAFSVSCRLKALARRYGGGLDARLFAFNSNLDYAGFRRVDSVVAMLADPFFRRSDFVCYDFGIYYELFNSIFALPARIKKIAVYHNITPEHLMAGEGPTRAVRDAIRQKANLLMCDLVIADSEYNRRDLLGFGIAPEKLAVVELPLPVGFDPVPLQVPPAGGFVDLLFVGRFVPSKGIADLVDAAIALMREGRGNLRVSLVGDETFSDKRYARELRAIIAGSEFAGHFRFIGSVSPAELKRHYEASHILVLPSYHEGFCLPAIEAFATGCVVVGYRAGNLPFITDGLGRLVETGDRAALARAIGEIAGALSERAAAPETRELPLDCGLIDTAEYNRRCASYLERFTLERFCDNYTRTLARGLGI